MKEHEPRTVFYEDETTDDFAGVERKKFTVPENWVYNRKGLPWRAAAFAAYRVIMTPVAYFYCKLKFGMTVKDFRTARPKRDEGCFLFSNHTMLVGDAFAPSVAMFPKKVYVVVGGENLATKGTRTFLQAVGALPVPESFSGMKKFVAAVDERISEGHCVTVYPEAHVWPYFIGIRPFSQKSFRFPVKNGAAVFVSTATYRKRRHGKIPKVTLFLDGPFYADKTLPLKEAETELRDRVFETMKERAKNSDYEFIRYRKKDSIE